MNDNPRWTPQAKAVLDDSARDLDAATLSRLNRARQAALAQRRAPRRWILPAGLASACMLLLAVALWRVPPTPHASVPAVATSGSGVAEDNIADDDEFYEDLDFYAWLDAQDDDL